MKFSNNYQGWFVLLVKSQWEKKVHSNLIDMGIESFLPLISKVHQWSDRKKRISKPLFPCYIFININTSLEFNQALSVTGCLTCLRFGDRYARVTEKEIDQIKFLVGEKEITDIVTSPRIPKIGETKKITYGALTGLNCEIINADNPNKIIVRIDSLRMDIMATIPSYILS